MRKMRAVLTWMIVLAVLAGSGLVSAATVIQSPGNTRIKDVAKVQGVRANQLVGYGLVFGLAGTGDSNKSVNTIQSVVNMLRSFGVLVDQTKLQSKNVAAVMISAKLPAFVKSGDNIDVTVSSMGDAKSLAGGTLIQTPLRAANGNVYAVAQGPVTTGGFAAGGTGANVQKNFPTVGLITNGAIVERDVPFQIGANGQFNLALNRPDFTTATRIAEAITQRFGTIATARDPGTVTVSVPGMFGQDVVGFVAAIEELRIRPDEVARVVINERTGTIVMGSNVSIDEVAVAQGGLTVKITKTREVSQPLPFSQGRTVTTPRQSVNAQEGNGNLLVLPSTASVGDVVAALNSVGATPRDIITILQAMKAAGALHAEMELI
ncbi:MAG: flagellar basal body P-ring protein FlgI [Veillonellaceae bacterium]|jgi:flagellar P-ring protein precursor FlgI|nr:flagellar basal body P-ring protein FlgI [Veillonellaceae bacterium]